MEGRWPTASAYWFRITKLHVEDRAEVVKDGECRDATAKLNRQIFRASLNVSVPGIQC